VNVSLLFFPSSIDLVEALIPINGNLVLSNVDADLEVNLECSLALSIIILVSLQSFFSKHAPLPSLIAERHSFLPSAAFQGSSVSLPPSIAGRLELI